MAHPASSPKRRTARSKPSNVVVATGPYQRPCMPDLLRDDTDVFQVHASSYPNPEQLPPGAVLVVGAGASGRADRRGAVARRPPRLSRCRPAHPHAAPLPRTAILIWWLGALGLFDHDAGATRAVAVDAGRSQAPMAATPSTSAASPPRHHADGQ